MATEAERASDAKYAASERGRARLKRYEQSAKGRAVRARVNARRNALRLLIGGRYAGVVKDQTQAAVINAHIKERLLGFKQRQSAGTQAEGVS